MGQTINHGNRKKEKGLTLVEVVISLSVIVIVSIAMVSIAIYSSNAQRKISVGRFFRQHIDNSLNLYQSYSDTDFETAFNSVNNQSITFGNDVTFYLNDSFEYVGDTSNAEYQIAYDFETNSLKVSASYYGGDLIAERSTTK